MTTNTSLEQPYDSNIYAGISLTLRQACQKFESRGADRVVYTEIRECFLKHQIEDLFSACLLHRHFNLADNERNIEVDGKAIASADIEDIHTSSWMFHNGKLYPWEFVREVTPSPPSEFVEELGEILQKHGLEDLIGFQIYTDGVVGLESTDVENRVSTTLSQKESEKLPKGIAPASWAFSAKQSATNHKRCLLVELFRRYRMLGLGSI